MSELKAGKYQAYHEYKDSGVEWLGDIPIHWNTLRHKYIASYIKGKNPSILQGEASEGMYPYLSMDSLRGKAIEQYAILSKGMYLAKNGQPLIIWDGSNAGEFVKGKNGILSSTMAAAVLHNSLNINFYWYLCLCIEPEMRKHANGMGIPHVNGAELKNVQLVLPLAKEQARIASYLDYETAKIDTLIEKQQQLIKLLKEKRQAVISHAVTKGIPNKEHPQTPMKASGVEWLGQVPEHWVVTKIKYITSLFEQGWSPQCDSRTAEVNEYGILKVGCVNHGIFKPLENKALPKELEPKLQYIINKGDLLISRANTKELVGSAAVVTKDYENLILCDKLYRLKLNSNVSPELLSLYLSISAVRGQIELGASGASHSMQNIGQDVIKELPCFVIPHEESLRLLEYIKGLLNKFSLIINKSELQIRLLQERRTALISAAVTGKIDVRNWEQPNDE